MDAIAQELIERQIQAQEEANAIMRALNDNLRALAQEISDLREDMERKSS